VGGWVRPYVDKSQKFPYAAFAANFLKQQGLYLSFFAPDFFILAVLIILSLFYDFSHKTKN